MQNLGFRPLENNPFPRRNQNKDENSNYEHIIIMIMSVMPTLQVIMNNNELIYNKLLEVD